MDFIIAIAGGALGLFGVAITVFFQRKAMERRNEIRNVFTERYLSSFTKNYDKLLEKYEKGLPPDNRVVVDDLKDYTLRDFRNMLAHYPVPSKEIDIEAEVNSRIEEINKKIETIEARLPKKATLDKLASVNDAILATQIEALTESVNDLKKNMLTKWDVAKVVFAIIGALGVISGIIIGILNVIQQS